MKTTFSKVQNSTFLANQTSVGNFPPVCEELRPSGDNGGKNETSRARCGRGGRDEHQCY